MNHVTIFFARDLVYLVTLVCLATLLVERKRRVRLLITLVVACVLAFIFAKTISHFFYDPRPFVIERVQPLVPHSRDNGFPSDHSLFTMMLATVVFFANRRVGLILAGCSVLIGLARVEAELHSPFQVLGGWLLGAVCGVMAYLIVQYIAQLYHKSTPTEKK